MHSYNHLFEKIIEYDNLKTAIMRSSEGKRDRNDVVKVLRNKDKCISEIQKMLTTETFVVPHHIPKIIYDESSKKNRKIIKPDYKYEQIIHHAIIQVISPIMMKSMYEYSCGSIPNRGACYGKKKLESYIRKYPNKCKYVLKIDIHHFFPSISHNKLKEMLRNKFHDEKLLRLLFLIIDSYCDSKDEHDEYGLPIGYYTSQWFANFYLTETDHYIKEDLHADLDIRYMDDMVMFADSKDKLHYILGEIKKHISDVSLVLKSNYQIFKFGSRDINFMGFRFFADHTIIRKNLLRRLSRKANKLSKQTKICAYESAQMLSLLSWFSKTDCHNYFENHIKELINVKQLLHIVSKHDRRQYELVQIRINGRTAKTGIRRRPCLSA